MMVDRHLVALATEQVSDGAALRGGAAAEQTVGLVLGGGRVGDNVGLDVPGDQQLVGRTVQGGCDVVRRARGWQGGLVITQSQ